MTLPSESEEYLEKLNVPNYLDKRATQDVSMKLFDQFQTGGDPFRYDPSQRNSSMDFGPYHSKLRRYDRTLAHQHFSRNQTYSELAASQKFKVSEGNKTKHPSR